MVLNPAQFPALAKQLATSGGYTVSPRGGTQPSSGVSVAVPGHEVAIPGLASASQIRAHAADRDTHTELQRPGRHLGAWHNDADNKTYLDVSKVIPEHPRGHHVADVHNAMHVNRQIASFDLRSATEIPNPRFADYSESERAGGHTPPDEHGSSMRIVRPATPRG